MTPRFGDPRVELALSSVRRSVSVVPDVGVVLGSGLGAFAESLGELVRIPFADVPSLPCPSVAGHPGALCFGRVGQVKVACLAGRVHLYEGHSADDVVLGCRLLAALGCRVVLLTNAAGGIRSNLSPGSLMLLVDHLNLTGRSPLIGTAAFVDLTAAYDTKVAEVARESARDLGLVLHEGVYAGLLGPNYETPAEIRMLRQMGADAVGMSTVMEVIALRQLKVRVGAMSCITNLAAGLADGGLSHAEVERTAGSARTQFESLLGGWIARSGSLPREGS